MNARMSLSLRVFNTNSLVYYKCINKNYVIIFNHVI